MSDTIKNSPAMMTVLENISRRLSQTNDRLAAQDFDHDTCLAWLTGRVGGIVNTMGPFRREDAVLNSACAAFAWLEKLKLDWMNILALIAAERLRQRQLFAKGKHRYTVSSPIVGWTRKFRTLIEEVGELAEAVDQLEATPRSKPARQHFQEELVQVAAVCVAWLESFESKEGK